MFTNTNTNSVLSAIRDNRAEKNPLKLERSNVLHVSYREAVESLRLSASRLAASVIQTHESERIFEFNASITNDFKHVLNILGEPEYTPSTSDVDAVIAMVGTFRTVDGKKHFVPVSEKTFRNYFEKFIAIRANDEIVKNAETIKADKKAARKARKEAKKAANAAPAVKAESPAVESAVEVENA